MTIPETFDQWFDSQPLIYRKTHNKEWERVVWEAAQEAMRVALEANGKPK